MNDRELLQPAPAVSAVQIGMKASTWETLSPDAQNLILEAGQRAVDKTKAQRLADAAARATMAQIPLDGSAAPAAVFPLSRKRHDLQKLVENIKIAVHQYNGRISVTEAIGALEIAKMEIFQEQ